MIFCEVVGASHCSCFSFLIINIFLVTSAWCFLKHTRWLAFCRWVGPRWQLTLELMRELSCRQSQPDLFSFNSSLAETWNWSASFKMAKLYLGVVSDAYSQYWHIYMYMYIYVYLCIPMYIYVYLCISMYIYVYLCISMYIMYISVYTSMYTYVYTSMYIYVYTSMYIHLCISMYIHLCISMYIYVYLCISMYIYVYLCISMYIYIYA